MANRWNAALAIVVLISGCNSTFETRQFDTKTWTASKESVEGVIYYEQRSVAVIYEFTAAVDKEGNFLTRDCERMVQKIDITTLPDYSKPRVVINKPGLFAAGKLGVTLNNGMLASVNSESTPQAPQLFQTLEQALKDKVLGLEVERDPRKPAPTKACNASPTIKDIILVRIGSQ